MQQDRVTQMLSKEAGLASLALLRGGALIGKATGAGAAGAGAGLGVGALAALGLSKVRKMRLLKRLAADKKLGYTGLTEGVRRKTGVRSQVLLAASLKHLSRMKGGGRVRNPWAKGGMRRVTHVRGRGVGGMDIKSGFLGGSPLKKLILEARASGMSDDLIKRLTTRK